MLARRGPATALSLLLGVVFLFASSDGPNALPSQGKAMPRDPALPAATAWLRNAAVPFSQFDPEGSLDDLEPLRAIVGDARIVSLGEATHGTREFFLMKHRILRFLVERMGFTAFAIEATWPEANRLDHYVRTGEGDPAVLLSGLYFWTWNTDEVLRMIRWMRKHNEAGGNVGFYGFDMQYPGMAIENVTRFVSSVDGKSSVEVAQHLLCLERCANDARGRFPAAGYASQTPEYRDACRQDLQWVEDTLVARRKTYEAASSAGAWARASHSARVAIQYEEMASNRRTRDVAMADNVAWLVGQLPPDGKIVLWAHNGHVSTQAVPTWTPMGYALRQTYGKAMVVMGFSFARGSFNAVGQSGSTYTTVGAHTVDDLRAQSYEYYFRWSHQPQFFLDLRGRSGRADTPAFLAGPRYTRSIGAVYNEAAPSQYWYSATLPQEYDVSIFIERTTPSVLLPFNHPSTF